MGPPTKAYRPYAAQHQEVKGAGDARPTALQVVEDCEVIGKLKGRTVLITGCSSGIGVETARALYEAGATLFLTARDMPKLDGVINDIVKNAKYNKDGPRPQPIQMELDSLDSVRKGAEDFKQKSGGKLNILITNAGVMACPYSTTKDGFETQIGVNHFAHFLLFQLVKPCLLSSAKSSGTTSRVVSLTSAGHRFGGLTFSNKAELDAWNKGENYHKWLSYGDSKTANIYLTNAISRYYGSQNLHGWSVHPGGIMTELGRHLDASDFEAFGGLESFEKIMKSPPQGAATSVWAAVSPHFEGKNGGQYLADVGESDIKTKSFEEGGEAAYAEWAYDEGKEDTLWKISNEVVGVAD